MAQLPSPIRVWSLKTDKRAALFTQTNHFTFIELFVSGLFNRGQENEIVKLEAAAKCFLDSLMLLRYSFGKNGLPIQSETKVFLFSNINQRKGNLVRQSHSKKKEKDETFGKAILNFFWNLDRTIWAGMSRLTSLSLTAALGWLLII